MLRISFKLKILVIFLLLLNLGVLMPVKLFNKDLPILIPRKILFGNPEKASPQISPDGKKLAYLAPVNGVLNVFVKTIGKSNDYQISKDTNRGIQMYGWAYNNQHLFYVQDKNGDENWHIYRVDLNTKKTVDMTPFEGVLANICASEKEFPSTILICMNKENAQIFDVYRLDIQTGALELVEKNPGNIAAFIADKNLVVRAAQTFNDDGGVSLLVRETDKDPWKIALTWGSEDALKVQCFGFSKDGNKLYLKDPSESNTARLIEYDIISGQKKVLAQDDIFDITTAFFNTDHTPLVACILKERISLVSLNKEFDATLKAMQNIDDGDLFATSASNDDRYWVLGFIHDNQATKYYLFDKEKQTAEFIFFDLPELNKYQLAKMETISFIARDGLKIHGYLTCPVGVQHKNLPLVLLVHGGPWGRDAWGLDSLAQVIANRGHACLQVNFRGSDGYGKSFLNAGDREWGGKMHDDLIDAVNWAIDQGIADPKKIAIVGGSYGGYAALVGATFTPDVFCCAVDICGPSNLITFLETVPPYWISFKKQFDLRLGDIEKDTEFLKSRSPLFKVDNIKIPILIGQGVNDPRVKQAESEQIVEALKIKGLEYEYVLFPDEGHGFVKPENRLKFCAIMEKFLAKYLGGRYEE
ncbi:MAG: S9 family peptidase [Candidatus Babeliales bacterium]